MSSPKRVLLVNFSKAWGGGELQHLELALEFKRQGFWVGMLLQPNSQLLKKAHDNRIETYTQEISKHSFLSPITLFQIKRLLNQLHPNAIILNGSMELKHIAFCTSRKKFNTIYRRGYHKHIKPTWLNKFCFGRINHLVAISEFVKNRALTSVEKYCANPIQVIHNGIPLVHGNGSVDYQSQKIVAIGRLVNYKRFDIVIEAMPLVLKKRPNATLYIAGEGPQRQNLEQLISRHALERSVILMGFQQNVQSVFNDAALFVHTAKEEAFGVVFLEAMQRKLPCIAFSGHAADEIIEPGKTGILVDAFLAEELASAIVALLENNNNLAKMGQAGYDRFLSQFSIESSVKKFSSLIN